MAGKTTVRDGTVGWGVIGCGDVVARKSGPSIQHASGSELVAVMRRSPVKAEAFAREHRVPFWTTDADELIQHPDVDIVYIAAPPMHHLEYGLRVCQAGKPCMVEKPLTRSAAECSQLVDAFAKAGVPLYASYYRRAVPKFQKVKEILGSGALGTLVSIHYQFATATKSPAWRQNPRRSGGGGFYDIGGHVLDLFDSWFGPIEATGGGAANLSWNHDTEDVVSLSFRTAEGTLGLASWSFVSPLAVDRLEILGSAGRLTLGCASCDSPLRVERFGKRARRRRRTFSERLARLFGKGRKSRKPRQVVEEHAFEPLPYVHQPLIETILAEIRDGVPCESSGRTALRHARLMDTVLGEYYGGREDAFWDHPTRWKSERIRTALARPRATPPLSGDEVAFFEEHGYLGPFEIDPELLAGLRVRPHAALNMHLEDPALLEICCATAIVDRVDRLLGSQGTSLFKSRFWVKEPRSDVEVPWHQDVGPRNGGFRPDGSPVESITAWLAIDPAGPGNGGLQIIPKSHRLPLADLNQNIEMRLDELRERGELDLASAVTLELKPGQVYLFHSWLLHSSGRNEADSRRAALNIRFVAPHDERESDAFYLPVR